MVKLLANVREIQGKHGVMAILSYLTLLLSNLAVIYLAHLLSPTDVVLGTFALSSFWALCLSVGKVTLLGFLVMLAVPYLEYRRKKDFAPMDWMKLYFVVNALALWLVTRYAEVYGLGVSSWVVIVVLALVMDMVQGVTMMQLGKIKLK